MNFHHGSFLVFILFASLFPLLTKGGCLNKLNGYGSSKDTLTMDSLKIRAAKAVEECAKLRPTATTLQTEFLNYKIKAKGSKGGAIDEANDGFQMACDAVKDCEEIDKIGKKVAEATPKKMKINDMLKMVLRAETRIHNIKYLIHQTEDRRKEVQFELKGR